MRSLLGSINAKTINVIGLHKILDPRLVARDDIWQLCVDIRQRNLRVAEPAVLLAGDVAVIDWTIFVVVCLPSISASNSLNRAAFDRGKVTNLILEHVLVPVGGKGSSHNIIDDHVDHQIPKHGSTSDGGKKSIELPSHATLVNLVGQGFEVVRGTKAGIQLCGIRNPVSMVGVTIGAAGTFVILRDRTDPNWAREMRSKKSEYTAEILTGCEPSILNVVQVFTNGVPSAPTPSLVRWVAFGGVCAVRQRVTIGNNPKG